MWVYLAIDNENKMRKFTIINKIVVFAYSIQSLYSDNEYKYGNNQEVISIFGMGYKRIAAGNVTRIPR